MKKMIILLTALSVAMCSHAQSNSKTVATRDRTSHFGISIGGGYDKFTCDLDGLKLPNDGIKGGYTLRADLLFTHRLGKDPMSHWYAEYGIGFLMGKNQFKVDDSSLEGVEKKPAIDWIGGNISMRFRYFFNTLSDNRWFIVLGPEWALSRYELYKSIQDLKNNEKDKEWQGLLGANVSAGFQHKSIAISVGPTIRFPININGDCMTNDLLWGGEGKLTLYF